MERLDTRLQGPILIAPRIIGDERGFFCETFRTNVYADLGIPEAMVQDNHSRSSTFGQWEGFQLDDENMHVLYCPIGFAHGFCTLSDVADVMYKQSNYYADATERGIAFDDPDVAIQWPLPADQLTVSARDASAPTLAEIADSLPFTYAPA